MMKLRTRAWLVAAAMILPATAASASPGFPFPFPRPTSSPQPLPDTGTDTVFSFSGLCEDCIPGTLQPVSALLTLRNYNPGDTIFFNNFVSFRYNGSTILPEGFTITNADAFRLGGSIGETLPGSYGVAIDGSEFYFRSSTTGRWDLGSFGTSADFGGNGIYSGVVAAIPEPTTWGAMILGFGAIAVRLRRRQKATAVAHA